MPDPFDRTRPLAERVAAIIEWQRESGDPDVTALIEDLAAALPSPMLQPGDNPSLGYCRICGTKAVPPYEGYYADSVCSLPCWQEWQWRRALRTLQHPYARDVRRAHP